MARSNEKAKIEVQSGGINVEKKRSMFRSVNFGEYPFHLCSRVVKLKIIYW